MKKLTIILVLLFTTHIHVFAQSDESSILWEITGDSVEEPSYIFGTIHIACPEDFVFYEEVKDAIDKSDKVLMELDMDDPQMMAKMQQLSLRQDGENIKDLLSEKDFEILNEFMKKEANMDMNQMGVLKPMVIMSVVMMKMMPCETITSYEGEIVNRAVTQKIEIAGLETVEEQMGLFDKISTKEQFQWIMDMVKDTAKFKDDFVALSDVYKSNDVEAIYQHMLEFPEFEEYADLLLVQRNKKWISDIEKYIGEKPTFIAVGAGHLGSENGVIALLREQGYTLKPIAINE